MKGWGDCVSVRDLHRDLSRYIKFKFNGPIILIFWNCGSFPQSTTYNIMFDTNFWERKVSFAPVNWWFIQCY